jgi:hypothetical protein
MNTTTNQTSPQNGAASPVLGVTPAPPAETENDLRSSARAYNRAEDLAHASERAKLREIDYVERLGTKSGRRLARKAFAARCEALRTR